MRVGGLLHLWLELPPQQHKPILLEALLSSATRAAKHRRPTGRLLTPELSVKALSENDGQGFHDLATGLCYPQAEDAADGYFPNLGNGVFERLTGMALGKDAQVTLARSRRAFIEHFVLLRHEELHRFVGDVLVIVGRISGVDSVELHIGAPPVSPAPGPLCAACYAPALPGRALAKCGRCRDRESRDVHYCGSEHQLAHRKLSHKQVCGVPAVALDIPLFDTSATALPADLNTLRRFLDTAPRVPYSLPGTPNCDSTFQEVFWSAYVYGDLMTCLPPQGWSTSDTVACAASLRAIAYRAIDNWHSPGIEFSAIVLILKLQTSVPGLDPEQNLDRMAALFRISRDFVDERMAYAEEEVQKGGEEWEWVRKVLAKCRQDLDLLQSLERLGVGEAVVRKHITGNKRK